MANLFSSKEAKKDRKEVKRNFEVGMHEDVFLTELEVKQTDSGKKYLCMMFTKDAEGLGQEKRLWFPNLDSPLVRDGETKEEAVQRQINKWINDIMGVVETYLPSDKAAIVADDMDTFAGKAIAKIKPFLSKKVALRIKVIFDSKGQYTQIGGSYGPFMERFTEGDGHTRLYFSKYEKENRLKPATPENDSAITNSTGSDLPF